MHSLRYNHQRSHWGIFEDYQSTGSKTEKQKEEEETYKGERDARGHLPGAQTLQKGEARCSRERRKRCAPMHYIAPQLTPPVNLKLNFL